jgi:feruloyl-CoA synthase
VIGLPAPGIELLLAPSGDRFEMRVRGPNVTPGYWERGGGKTPTSLDENGFLPTGDAGRFEDSAAPEKGVVFDGRIAENFKLTSGTWVSAMEVRLALVAACAPLVADAVIAGHDRDHLAALLIPNLPACKSACEGGETLDFPSLLSSPSLRSQIAAMLAAHNAGRPASSTRIPRAMFLVEPLSIDGGEITDKGYVNQRAVLTRRAILVEKLYAQPIPEEVIAEDQGKVSALSNSA